MKFEVEDVTITYTQEEDSCDRSNSPQELKIFTEDAGGGKYIVFETERWAIDSIDELIEILNNFKTRAGIK
jgi:hypothetical protein